MLWVGGLIESFMNRIRARERSARLVNSDLSFVQQNLLGKMFGSGPPKVDSIVERLRARKDAGLIRIPVRCSGTAQGR